MSKHHVTVEGKKHGFMIASLRYLDTFTTVTDRACSLNASCMLTGWSNARCRDER